MKTNYKAIGLRIKFIRIMKEKTYFDVENFLGEGHQNMQIKYEDGDFLTKEIINKISDYFKRCPHPQLLSPYNINSYGNIYNFKNIFTLHLQYSINKSRLKLSDICDQLEIARNTLTNWLEGDTLPKEGKIYRLAEFMVMQYPEVSKLINLSE